MSIIGHLKSSLRSSEEETSESEEEEGVKGRHARMTTSILLIKFVEYMETLRNTCRGIYMIVTRNYKVDTMKR